jgi:predicted nucleic acid-binding protein
MSGDEIRQAEALGCGVVWSEDLSDGQVYDDVRVVNPF